MGSHTLARESVGEQPPDRSAPLGSVAGAAAPITVRVGARWWEALGIWARARLARGNVVYPTAVAVVASFDAGDGGVERKARSSATLDGHVVMQ